MKNQSKNKSSNKARFKSLPALAALLLFLGSRFVASDESDNTPKASEVRYAAVGDSYTIGEGANPQESWPALLTAQLNKTGIPISLVANPSVTGWTSQQAIDNELPIFEASKPTFATLLIGVNDWVQGVDAVTFRKRLIIILDRMQAALPDKSHLVVVTIPDFSVTPTGAMYTNGRDAAAGIADFNAIIVEEAKKRALKVVDIYPISKDMGRDASLVAADGLHPSAKEYAIWEKLIYPVAGGVLKPATPAHKP